MRRYIYIYIYIFNDRPCYLLYNYPNRVAIGPLEYPGLPIRHFYRPWISALSGFGAFGVRGDRVWTSHFINMKSRELKLSIYLSAICYVIQKRQCCFLCSLLCLNPLTSRLQMQLSTKHAIITIPIADQKEKINISTFHICHTLLPLLALPLPFPEERVTRFVLELLVATLVVLDICHVFSTS